MYITKKVTIKCLYMIWIVHWYSWKKVMIIFTLSQYLPAHRPNQQDSWTLHHFCSFQSLHKFEKTFGLRWCKIYLDEGVLCDDEIPILKSKNKMVTNHECKDVSSEEHKKYFVHLLSKIMYSTAKRAFNCSTFSQKG